MGLLSWLRGEQRTRAGEMPAHFADPNSGPAVHLSADNPLSSLDRARRDFGPLIAASKADRGELHIARVVDPTDSGALSAAMRA